MTKWFPLAKPDDANLDEPVRPIPFDQGLEAIYNGRTPCMHTLMQANKGDKDDPIQDLKDWDQAGVFFKNLYDTVRSEKKEQKVAERAATDNDNCDCSSNCWT